MSDIDIMAEMTWAANNAKASGQRKGQHMFNRLTQLNPVLADKVRGSIVDPFYNDKNIPGFMAFVGGYEPLSQAGETSG